jgi:hypothetical protein
VTPTELRTKLAAALNEADGYGPSPDAVDALVAIVREAEDAKVEECAQLVQGASSYVDLRDFSPTQLTHINTTPMANALRALKSKAGA